MISNLYVGIIFGHFHRKLAMKILVVRKAPAMPKLTHFKLIEPCDVKKVRSVSNCNWTNLSQIGRLFGVLITSIMQKIIKFEFLVTEF